MIENMSSIVAKVTKLSHKQFRAELKKFRRKKKRQLAAREREALELLEQERRESSPNFQEREADRRRNAALYDEAMEKESKEQEREWIRREKEAQILFKRRQQQLELEKIKKEEERKRILAEFEQQQFLDTKAKEETQKLKSRKEEALQEALSNLPQGDGPWHNPIAPVNFNVGKERDQCQFFVKTGCCRFGERCSRGHVHPAVSTTILIRGMYSHFSIGQSGRDDFDTDNALEYEDKERYQDFKNFYFDVLPEFKKCGKVVQFKVCSNHEPHLRGNVYVQFSTENEAVAAYKNFNGRYYAGRQMTCEFTNVIKWRSAICGLFFRKLCPKGINCNFLHVFKNPSDEFREADRDFSYREFETPSHSSRSNGSRQRSERRSSHRGYSRESYRERYDDSPDRRSLYHQGSSRRHNRTSESESDDQENSRYGSSGKHSGRRRDSPHRSKHRSKHRKSRSRSLSPSPDDSESLHSHRSHKHKKKKKSKKSKREKGSDRSSDD